MKQATLTDLKERIALADIFTPDERNFILAAVNAAVDAVALGSVECPHCHWGIHPSHIKQHIREKH